jgi:hypothetical protein
MSAYWRPTHKGAKSLSVLMSNDLAVLREVFGYPEGPVKLIVGDAPRLRAMAVAAEWARCGAGPHPGTSAYDEIADLLDAHESIEVWGEW